MIILNRMPIKRLFTIAMKPESETKTIIVPRGTSSTAMGSCGAVQSIAKTYTGRALRGLETEDGRFGFVVEAIPLRSGLKLLPIKLPFISSRSLTIGGRTKRNENLRRLRVPHGYSAPRRSIWDIGKMERKSMQTPRGPHHLPHYLATTNRGLRPGPAGRQAGLVPTEGGKAEMRHIMLISGKDSLATAIVQREREPNLPYEYIHNETGWDLPDTLEWLRRVEHVLGISIYRCGDDLTEICFEQNCLPLAGIRRFCTKYAKIRPLNDYLGCTPATIYFGLRFDEPQRQGYTAPKYQVARYPLVEC